MIPMRLGLHSTAAWLQRVALLRQMDDGGEE